MDMSPSAAGKSSWANDHIKMIVSIQWFRDCLSLQNVRTHSISTIPIASADFTACSQLFVNNSKSYMNLVNFTLQTVVHSSGIPTLQTVVHSSGIPTLQTVVHSSGIPTLQTVVHSSGIPTLQTVVHSSRIPTLQTVVHSSSIPTDTADSSPQQQHTDTADSRLTETVCIICTRFRNHWHHLIKYSEILTIEYINSGEI
jgi:hypothetical protein